LELAASAEQALETLVERAGMAATGVRMALPEIMQAALFCHLAADLLGLEMLRAALLVMPFGKMETLFPLLPATMPLKLKERLDDSA
jgi:hypothetical protein